MRVYETPLSNHSWHWTFYLIGCIYYVIKKKCAISELITVIKIGIKEPVFASAIYPGKKHYLENCYKQNHCTLWIYGYSTNSNQAKTQMCSYVFLTKCVHGIQPATWSSKWFISVYATKILWFGVTIPQITK